MDSFYAPPESITPAGIVVEGEEFSHLTHVMRKQAGDTIRVVDGAGNAYIARIAEISRHAARCAITGHTSLDNEPVRHITLAAGILKNAGRFDYLVEKAVELGAGTIVPLLTERTIPRHARTERWQKLALSAMKQSGRCVLPPVRPLTPLASFLASARGAALRLIPHEQTVQPQIQDAVRAHAGGPAAVCIGPEGGFTDDEVAQALAAGFVAVSLGPRRLRTETAALAALQTLLTA